LALITGQVGRPGHGPASVCAARTTCKALPDAGLIPMFLPDYQPIGRDDPARAFEKLWGQELDPCVGLPSSRS